MTRNERAAAMRQTWLGDAAGEAVAWDELKQCVRDRWLAALDAAQPDVPQPLGYCPADVAFNSRVPELEKKIDNQRMNLRQLHDLREKERAERDRLERELKDIKEDRDALRAELAAAEIELADLRFYQREFASVSQERDGLKKRNDIQAEQLIRIDSEISPLMSEVAELKAERDAARAELAAARAALETMLAAEVDENVRLRTREVGDEVGNLLQEVADLKNELARVKAESLRVVKDGDVCYWDMLEDSDKDGLFLVDSQLCCRDKSTMDKVVNVSTGAVSYIYDEETVQPVCLERWEANDDNH